MIGEIFTNGVSTGRVPPVSRVGLKAPHILKLICANFNCSMKNGKADSLILPIICLEISNPASCSFNFS